MSRVLLGKFIGGADGHGLSAPFENYFQPASGLGPACGVAAAQSTS
jgi:hypothetical protein